MKIRRLWWLRKKPGSQIGIWNSSNRLKEVCLCCVVCWYLILVPLIFVKLQVHIDSKDVFRDRLNIVSSVEDEKP